MKRMFEEVLDKDEEVIKVFEPNKTKLYFASFFIYFVSVIWMFGVAVAGIVSETTNYLPYLLLAVSIFAAITIIVFIFVRIYYNNLFYAYTNKRIIIRKGILGVDYKALDMKTIGAVNVYVSPLDKLLKRNTGTIMFGSMSSPIQSYNGSAGAAYKFTHIVDPYSTYREIKSKIDEYK